MKKIIIPIWNYFIKPIVWDSMWIPIRTIFRCFVLLFYWVAVFVANICLIIWNFSFDGLYEYNDYEVEVDFCDWDHKKYIYRNAIDFILKRNIIKIKK